jgi:hypothetical protein
MWFHLPVQLQSPLLLLLHIPPSMMCVPYRRCVICTYVFYIVTRHIFLLPCSLDQHVHNLQLDISILLTVIQTHYLNGQPHILKAGNLHLAWEYAKDPATYNCFISMLQVIPVAHHDMFCCKPMVAEIEVEKKWIEDQIGVPEWRDGWLMYDGTIVVLFK